MKTIDRIFIIFCAITLLGLLTLSVFASFQDAIYWDDCIRIGGPNHQVYRPCRIWDIDFDEDVDLKDIAEIFNRWESK